MVEKPSHPVGRPRLTAERRRQIVAAFLRCVAEQGLRQASMGAVARAIGLDRSTVHHYFRSREELVTAAMEQIIEAYRAQVDAAVDALDPDSRLEQLLDFAFGPGFNDPGLSALLTEFFIAGRHDAKARAELKRAYEIFEDVVLAELEKRCPTASVRERHRVAWAIAQLIEGSSSFASLGFGPERPRAARETALALIHGLERTS